MARVDQPIELPTTPAGDQIDANVERPGYATQDIDRQPAEPSSLDPRNRRPGDASSSCEIHMPPASPDPDGSDGRAQPLILHNRTMEP
ncbi:MAG TPA: hypothetical protein VGQ47_03005 [Candidatus Limnocylindrales bacterium]|nr:hypothetical protein [Candidatus Limnocylindrales bacterium]